MVSGTSAHCDYCRLIGFLALSCFASVRPHDVPEFGSAPYYPTPHGGWVASWSESYAKADALVRRMSLAEKTNITAGAGFLMGERASSPPERMDYVDGNLCRTGSAEAVGFPQLCLQDGPLGVAMTDHVTAFPAGITTGATWDKALMYARGVAIGEEFRGKGVNVYLGPSVGPLGRKPLGGRNWEGFGSDPVLQAVAAGLTIRGVQEQGVIATVKHLVGNEQEMFRMYDLVRPAYSANIDDRTLHELYLWPFAEAVRHGVGAVMTAYNAVNGSACSQNSYLINHLLKDELGFQGFVVSDWLSHMSGVDSAMAGLDMDMPGDTQLPFSGTSFWKYELTRACLNGSMPMDRLNDMATRIVAAWYQVGQHTAFPPPNFSSNTADRDGPLYPAAWPLSPVGQVNWKVDVQADHASVAGRVAQDAITLLKHEADLLPLTAGLLHVFGTDARANRAGVNACPQRKCNVGTLGMGWGTGTAEYPYLDDPITALRKRADVTFYDTDTFPPLPTPVDAQTVALVFITSDSGENQHTVEGNAGDRSVFRLAAWHGGDDLVVQAAARYDKVVVVVHTVGPISVESWIDLVSVKAVLVAHLPGQEAGESLADVLFGLVSPSGHLPYTITRAATDLPPSVADLVPFALGQPQDPYTEGLYVDYRWLHRTGTKPRFAFGHGLTYTTFAFTNPSIRPVTPLTSLPPTRPLKGATPSYSQPIPPASEAYRPENFTTVWRYLYSFLPRADADAAHAIGLDRNPAHLYPHGYSDTQKPGPPAGGDSGGNPALWHVAFSLSLTVRNTGPTHAARAVAQAYLQFPVGHSSDTPILQLRDFAKTDTLAPNATQTLTLQLTRKDLSVWDVRAQNWRVPSVRGRYTVWIGEASDALFTACYTDTLTCETGLASPV